MEKGKKSITTIYLDNDIVRFCRDNHINLSEWVNREFIKQFMSLDTKVKELDETCKKVESLKEEINTIRARAEQLSRNFTTREIQFLRSVTLMLKEGRNINALWKRFILDFNRKIQLIEFTHLVKLYKK